MIINTVKRLIRGVLSRCAGQRGISLLETLIGLGILASVGIAFIQGVGAISISTDRHQQKITASALAQAQIEEIKSSDYVALPGEYTKITEPQGYTIDISVSELETDLQEITVSIERFDQYVLAITTYKVDR